MPGEKAVGHSSGGKEKQQWVGTKGLKRGGGIEALGGWRVTAALVGTTALREGGDGMELGIYSSSVWRQHRVIGLVIIHCVANIHLAHPVCGYIY